MFLFLLFLHFHSCSLIFVSEFLSQTGTVMLSTLNSSFFPSCITSVGGCREIWRIQKVKYVNERQEKTDFSNESCEVPEQPV